MTLLRVIITGLALLLLALAGPLTLETGGDGHFPRLDKRNNGAVSNWTNTQVTQLGVSMENLELYFIGKILDRYSDSDFVAEGYPSWVRGRMLQMQEHDDAHLAYLTAILNAVNETVPQPCQYPLEDALLSTGVENSLIFLCGIEQVVQSAYLGFEAYVHDPVENTIVAQYASSEARHQGWVLASALSEEPWSGPWDTVLTPDQTVAVLPFFSTSCPSSNPDLPRPTWPAVNIVGPVPTPEYDGPPGIDAQLNYSGILDKKEGETWINVQSGLGVEVIPLGFNGTFTVPADFKGFSYGMVVSTNETSYTANQLVAGPLAFHNGFNSSESDPGLKPVLTLAGGASPS